MTDGEQKKDNILTTIFNLQAALGDAGIRRKAALAFKTFADEGAIEDTWWHAATEYMMANPNPSPEKRDAIEKASAWVNSLKGRTLDQYERELESFAGYPKASLGAAFDNIVQPEDAAALGAGIVEKLMLLPEKLRAAEDGEVIESARHSATAVKEALGTAKPHIPKMF